MGSRVLYELDYRKPVLYVMPIQRILGKLAVVPVGDTGTIPYHLRNVFSGAPGNRRPGAGDGSTIPPFSSGNVTFFQREIPHRIGGLKCRKMLLGLKRD